MPHLNIRVYFTNGDTQDFEMKEGADWFFLPMAEVKEGEVTPTRLIIRPQGVGVPRYDIPLNNVKFIHLQSYAEWEHQMWDEIKRDIGAKDHGSSQVPEV